MEKIGMSKINNKLKSLLFLSLFMVQILAFSSMSDILEQNTGGSNDNDSQKDHNTNANNKLKDKSLDKYPYYSATPPNTWWNESYQFRIRVEINNTQSFSRNIPIEIDSTFTDGNAYNNTIRIVKFTDDVIEEWNNIPCQVIAATYSGNFYLSATILFVENSSLPGTNIYYIYYNSEDLIDDTDYGGNLVSSNLVGDNLNVQWQDSDNSNYEIIMDADYGMYSLVANDNGNNLHTGNSTAPGLRGSDASLIGYWSFEDDALEQTGNCPESGIGTGYIDYGDVNYDVGKYGKGRVFDGTNDYIAIDGDQDLYGGNTSTNGFTVMAWFNASSGSGERIIASWDRSEYWRLALADDDSILWATYAEGIDDMQINGVPDLTNGNFHHIAATYDYATGDKSIYLNGTLLRTDTNSHPDNTVIGDMGAPTGQVCYGFIGTGSEASSYGGTIGPNNEWNGTLDEFRIYNKSLSVDEINTAKDFITVTDVLTIQEEIKGDVMSEYSVLWNDLAYSGSDDMHVNDTLTFYRSMNAFKVTRDYEWDMQINPLLNNSNFAMYNTFLSWETDDPSPTVSDYYYYDNQQYHGHDDIDFTPENYTVLFDYDGDNFFNALGLYISDISFGIGASMSDIGWEIDIISSPGNNEIINFVPGNETDLYAPADIHLRVEFWQYAEFNYDYGGYSKSGNDPNVAMAKFDNIYQSLTTPLEIEVKDDEEESLFFILKLNVHDIDSNDVPAVNATIIHSNGTIMATGLTDSYGNVTFNNLESADYTLNLNYTKYGASNILELGNYPFTLDNTQTTYQNTRVLSYEVNMTSMIIHFESLDSVNLVGAEIEFTKQPSSELIGSEITDQFGNVTLHWSNFSSPDLLEFNCNFYSSIRLINNGSGPMSSLLEEFESFSYIDVIASVNDFETTMNQTNLAPIVTWGENLVYNFTYYYSYGGSAWSPIEDANVSYEFKYASDTIYQGSFNNTNAEGNSYNELDYNSSNIPLITGREYTFIVTISKDGYTPFTNISNVKIDPINTTLTADIGNVLSVQWNGEFSLSVFYNDTYNDAPINYTDTIVSYQSILHPEVSGIFLPDIVLGEGWFTAIINTTEDISTGPGNYTLRITATSQNYESQYIDHQLSISPILTSLQADSEIISVFWEYNFTISVQYNDTSDGPINDASVTWLLVTNPTINGIVSRDVGKGEGWYSVDVNSSLFINTGTYTLEITASSQNYDTIEKIIPLNIMDARTEIQVNDEAAVSDLLRMSVKIYKTDSYTIDVHYIKTDTSINIADTTSRLFTWSLSSDPTVFGTGDVNPIDDYYTVDFDTTVLEAGDYILLITLGQLNYEQKQAMILLTVEERIFDFQYGEDLSKSISKVSGNEIKLSLSLLDFSTGLPISNATVILSFDNSSLENIVFLDLDNDGIYTSNKTFTKDEVNAFFRDQTFIATLTISKEHYAVVEETISLTIKMAEIADGLPTFYLLLAVGALVIVSATIGGYKYVQYAKIPGFVKLLDKVKKDISNDKEVSTEKLTLSANEEITEKFGDIWELLDLNLSSILDSGNSSENENITKNDNLGGNN